MAPSWWRQRGLGWLALLALLGLTSGGALAQTATPAPAASITTLETLTVTGEVPGPGVWKVSHGTHTLWILAVVPTVPDGIRWQPAQVEAIIAHSQALIEPPGIRTKVEASWLGKLFLALPAYRAQRNADGKTLAEVLPAPLYARWQIQKQRYLPDDDGIERQRPFLAASKLLKAALKAHGLRSSGKIEDRLAAIAQQHGVALIKPEAELVLAHPRQTIKAFVAENLEGVECFTQLLNTVEQQLPALRARANAWATGDIDSLRRLTAPGSSDSCQSMLFNADFAKSVGLDTLKQRARALWLDAAQASLAANPQTLAVLPIHAVLDADGLLAALAARGYTVTPPDAISDESPAAASSSAPASASSAR